MEVADTLCENPSSKSLMLIQQDAEVSYVTMAVFNNTSNGDIDYDQNDLTY